VKTLPITSVKRFYFLRYFYILLEGVEKYHDKEKIFDVFRRLKLKYRLGESKYRRNISEEKDLTDKQINTYRYTFEQVIVECKEYDLISENLERASTTSVFRLKSNGRKLFRKYKNEGEQEANRFLFELMEKRYGAFRYFLEFLLASGNARKSLLVLPSYSPRQLGFEKSQFKTGSDVLVYLDSLIQKFNDDFTLFLGKSTGTKYSIDSLKEQSDRLISRLREAGLFPSAPSDAFRLEKYNSVTKRIRDFWITYFLRDIYRFAGSFTSFDIWAYRAKQFGILHVTEFYPSFSGRLAYPTSVIVHHNSNRDFEKLFEYPDGKNLFLHHPNPMDEDSQSIFIEKVYKAYLDLRRTTRSSYINIPPLREKVCYNMKISERLFETFLSEAYKLNLQGKLPFFSISLEVDRKPEETTAMYIKQEPIIIDGQYKNIIAIDMTKGGRK
jgi:hypothetical protein